MRKYLFLLINLGFIVIILSIYLITQFTSAKVLFFNKSLSAFTQIKKDDIYYKRIPKFLLNELMIDAKEKIIGKYLNPNYKVNKDDLVLDYMFINDHKDYLKLVLNSDEVAYLLDCSNIDLSKRVKIDNYIDVYLTTKNKEEIKSAKIFTNLRIIGLYDRNGQNLKNNQNSKISYIELALKSNLVEKFNELREGGKLSIVISS